MSTRNLKSRLNKLAPERRTVTVVVFADETEAEAIAGHLDRNPQDKGAKFQLIHWPLGRSPLDDLTLPEER